MVILVAIMTGIVLHQVGSVAVKTNLTVDHIPIKASLFYVIRRNVPFLKLYCESEMIRDGGGH